MVKPVIYGPEHASAGYSVVGERVHVLAAAADTGRGEAFIQEGPPGMGPPPHTHPWDEAYLMLDGEMDVLIGERTVHLVPGMFVYIPAGTPHNFRYTTQGRFFSYTSAAGAARFFAELDRDAPELPPNLGRIVEVALRNGVVPAGPPPQP
jgi:mannose-6-phosphate isomerase-like protein (cupin superfamily)